MLGLRIRRHQQRSALDAGLRPDRQRTTDGTFLYVKTEPRSTQKAVWVESAADSFGCRATSSAFKNS